MRRIRALFVRLAGLFRRRDDDLTAEIESHLELHTEDNLRAGMTPEAARRAAVLRLGGIEPVKESYRDRRGVPFLDHLWQDLRYGLRQLRHSPGFTAVAVLSLALGIGANTAIFSFMDAILMKSLPVKNPESLVVLKWHSKDHPAVMHRQEGSSYHDDNLGYVSGNFPFAVLEQVRSSASVDGVFAFASANLRNVVLRGEADRVEAEYVSGGYFSGLGIAPAAGRLIGDSDDVRGAPAAAMIAYGYAQRHYGSDASAVGQPILVDGVPFTVVGVAPPEFYGLNPAEAPDVYLPMHSSLLIEPEALSGNPQRKYEQDSFYWMEMMARLRPGIGIGQAQAELGPRFHNFVESTAKNDVERADLPTFIVEEGGRGLDQLRRTYGKPLDVLMTMVALILAIACANVANLLLARAATRRREIAVRLGIGAGRARVLQQLLTESMLLAGLGGVLGIVFAIAGIRSLTLLLANGRANFTLHATLDWRVLGVTLVLSLLTGVLFGLAPAIQATGVDVAPALKETRTGESRVGRGFLPVRLSQMLLVSQIAISLLLLVAAGLFTHTLVNLQSVTLGFNRANLLLFNLNVRVPGSESKAVMRFHRDLQARLAVIPGVRSATFSTDAPVSQAGSSTNVSLQGGFVDGPQRTNFLFVGSAFFSTMQIPMLLGREIEKGDDADAPAVAVINEAFARRYFGNQSPVGRQIRFGDDHDYEVVGVSKTARYSSLKEDPPPVVYIPYVQSFSPAGRLTYEVRTVGPPLLLANTVRQIVREMDARIPVAGLRTESEQIDQTIGQERTFATLCSGFAALALLIASVGLYGSMAFSVARRTNEIGIRMALGAQRLRIHWMVMRDVLVLSVTGLAIGLPVVYGGAKYLESFLFHMKADDPVAVSVAVGVLIFSAIAAGYIPARRASRIDPMTAVRHE
jgi:macrolide transport system ATP-binding/permease protein